MTGSNARPIKFMFTLYVFLTFLNVSSVAASVSTSIQEIGTKTIPNQVAAHSDAILELQGILWDIEEHAESCGLNQANHQPSSEAYKGILAQIAVLKEKNDRLKLEVSDPKNPSRTREKLKPKRENPRRSTSAIQTLDASELAHQADAIGKMRILVTELEQETEDCGRLQHQVDWEKDGAAVHELLFMRLKSHSADLREDEEHLRARAKQDVLEQIKRSKVFYAGVLAVLCAPIAKWTGHFGLPSLCE